MPHARIGVLVVLIAVPCAAVLAQSPGKPKEILPWLPSGALEWPPLPVQKPKAEAAKAVAKEDASKKKAETKKKERMPARKLFGAKKLAAALKPRVHGGYAKGCLAGGKQLAPTGPAWQAMRLSRNRNWAHPKLVALVERLAMESQAKENWPGLLVGDLAQPRGGPMLSGHKSHQVGLDADIWFKPMPKYTIPIPERDKFQPLLLTKANGTEVIAANWNDGFMRVVKRAASYQEVERIFVHPAIKKKFCELSGDDRAWLGKVRPIWLHNYHFHVRMRCPRDSPGCKKQKPPSGDHGCGKELEHWLKLVSRPSKPAPKRKTPAKPVRKREIWIEQLPSACKAVLAADDAKTDTQTAETPAKDEKAVKTARPQ